MVEAVILLMIYQILCVSNKAEEANEKAFYTMTGKNKSESSAKHKSCDSRRRLDDKRCNSKQNGTKIGVNVDVNKPFKERSHKKS